MRTPLPTERVEEVNGRSAVTDDGIERERYVEFWTPVVPAEDLDVQQTLAGQDITVSSHHSYTAPQRPCRNKGLTPRQEEI